MKKKILSLIFAICLLVPCLFIMTACKEDPPPGPSSPVISFGVSSGTVNFALRDINAMSPDDMTEPVFNGGTNEFSLWLADSYDRDTLKIYLNGAEKPWTQTDDPEYDSRRLDNTIMRKVGTLSLTDLKGDIQITVSCEEEEIDLVFAPQTLDAEKLEILSHFDFITKDSSGNNIETGLDTVAEEGFTITTTYSQIVNSENELTGYTKGILVESDKKMGYYDYYSMIMSEGFIADVMWDSHICGSNKYQSYVLMHADGGLPQEIPLSFNAEMIQINNFEVGGFSINDTITNVSHNSVRADENTAITISLNPYEGVDFTNAKAWIYDRAIPFENVGGVYQITIPAGAMPVDYYDNVANSKEKYYADAFSPSSFHVYVDGLDYSKAVFHTVELTGNLDTDISGGAGNPYYSEFRHDVIDGLHYYYYQSYYRHNYSATTGFIFTATELEPSHIILRENIDGVWTDTYVSISEYFTWDENEHFGEYVIENVVDDIDVVVNFSYGYLYSIYLRFNVQYDTLLLPNLG